MNDPQLDENIAEATNRVTEGDDQWAREKEDEEVLLEPARWWFASTACPLIAGTFGPIASGFNICAISSYWRQHLPPSEHQHDDLGNLIPDPHWLIGVNAISLAFALAGNGALLANMTGRGRFEVAQPITIIGFFIASLILIVLVVLANTSVLQLQPQFDYSLNQSYYYACYAAGIYMMISALMVLTVYGAVTGHYDKQFQLTGSQRTLMLQTITYMAYLLVGGAIFMALEDWRYLDAVFWAQFTLLTIGIGDQWTPKTHAGRSLLIPYTFGGILAVGLVISSIRSMLLEKGAQKIHARTTEKTRENVHDLDDAKFGTSRFEKLMRKKRGKHVDTANMSEEEVRKQEFLAMRAIQARAQKTARYRSLTVSVICTAILWFVGAVVFYETEYKQGWTYFQSVYFSWVMLITLGYGDFEPASNAGKSFFVFWTLLAIPTLTILVGDMGDTVIKGIADATNWIGSLTIVPSERGILPQLMSALHFITCGALGTVAEHTSQQNQRRTSDTENTSMDPFLRVLLQRLSETEWKDANKLHRLANDTNGLSSDAAHNNPDSMFYHYLLVREIRKVVLNQGSSPPKQYTYEEWAYFLRLLEEDETSPADHTRQYNHPRRDDEQAPQVARIIDHQGNKRKWSWLSLRSPLMSQMEESEWILHRLLKKLQQELHYSYRWIGNESLDLDNNVDASINSKVTPASSSSEEDDQKIQKRQVKKQGRWRKSPVSLSEALAANK